MPPAATKPLNIYQKLIEVRKTVEFLKKEKSGFQFKYVSSSQIIGSLRRALDAQGLILEPRITGQVVSDHTTAKEGHEYFTELIMTFTWVNAENPTEIIECTWYGQGLDSGEKGVGKALTYAEKYFLLKFFNIPTDKDDPDSNQGEPPKGKQQSAGAGKTSTGKETGKTSTGKENGGPCTASQIKVIYGLMREQGVPNTKYFSVISDFLKLDVTQQKEITYKDGGRLIAAFQNAQIIHQLMVGEEKQTAPIEPEIEMPESPEDIPETVPVNGNGDYDPELFGEEDNA